ncbi:ORF117 [Ranid herpesvirus 2]|uniref:ORF117 n=1 Tax=Ranid herpesvirus 2 TaxID=389214 RepID=Q14VY9_9VIRU|nr:ORF117 [Ranid herpesvirus 2]ABG25648.1 ORF117 [Ranid herpesvirus 2]
MGDRTKDMAKRPLLADCDDEDEECGEHKGSSYESIAEVLSAGNYGLEGIESFCAVWKQLILFARYLTLTLILLTFSIFLLFVSTDAWIWILKQNYHYEGNNTRSAEAVKQQDVMNVLSIGSIIFGSLMLLTILTTMACSWRHMAKAHYTMKNQYYAFRFFPLMLTLKLLAIVFFCMAWTRAILFIDCSKPIPFASQCGTVARYGAVVTLIFTLLYGILLCVLGGVVYFCITVKVNPTSMNKPPNKNFFTVSKGRYGNFFVKIAENVVGLKGSRAMNFKPMPMNAPFPLQSNLNTLHVH